MLMRYDRLLRRMPVDLILDTKYELLALIFPINSQLAGCPNYHLSWSSQALKKLKSGGCETAFFSINSKNENLQSDGDGKYTPEEIAKKMPQKEPRYAITKFRHVTPAEVGDGKQQQVAPFVFVYFCPDSAHPRLKMAYSSCKSMAVKLCEKYGIDIAKQVWRNATATLSVLLLSTT